MKKVALITTGGTIASKKNESGKLSSGEISGEDLAAMCQIPEDIKLEIHSLFQLPSMFMDFKSMLVLKNKIDEIFEDESINGVVVTHGTDSLEETAYFLDLTVSDNRRVVITGSQRSPEEVGSDVYSNLRNSILVAINEDIENAGAIIVFNERIWAAKYVKKVHASNLQGFESFGYGYLGIIDNDVVSIYQKPIRRDLIFPKADVPRVDIIKSYTGLDGTFIEASIHAGAKGIVIEGVGRGQVTPLMMDSIKKAIDSGIVVVITTSAEEGQVHNSYDYKGSANDLLNHGVILGKDYDSKKARIRLALLLSGNYEVAQENFS
jgi:L-asparaginase